MIFADKPWRPADHPSPGPSWRPEPTPVEADQAIEPNNRGFLFDQGGGVPPFTLPPSLSTADRVGDSAGIFPEAQA
jgi:hypothetical protein